MLHEPDICSRVEYLLLTRCFNPRRVWEFHKCRPDSWDENKVSTDQRNIAKMEAQIRENGSRGYENLARAPQQKVRLNCGSWEKERRLDISAKKKKNRLRWAICEKRKEKRERMARKSGGSGRLDTRIKEEIFAQYPRPFSTLKPLSWFMNTNNSLVPPKSR